MFVLYWDYYLNKSQVWNFKINILKIIRFVIDEE